MGWLYETILAMVSRKRWEHRGILYGPVCPIYGIGAASLIYAYNHLVKMGYTFSWWQIFLISFFGSMILEYVT